MKCFDSLASQWLGLPRDERGELIRGGLHRRDFLRWLVSPEQRGWFHACRALATGGPDIESVTLQEILKSLGPDDSAEVAMAVLHLECARLLSGQCDLPVAQLLAPAHLGRLVTRYGVVPGLVKDLLADLAAPEGEQGSARIRYEDIAGEIESPLLLIKIRKSRKRLKRKEKGVVATLTLQLIKDGRGDLHPSPAMAFVQCDEVFIEAQRAARRYLVEIGLWNPVYDVRWHLKLRGNKPHPTSLTGDSAGAAFALAGGFLFAHTQPQASDLEDEARGESQPVSPRDWIRSAKTPDLSNLAISAAIGPDGSLSHVGGLFEKLVAVARQPLSQIVAVLAAADQVDIESFGFKRDPWQPDIFDDCQGRLKVIRGQTLEEAITLWAVDMETPREKIIDCAPELRRHTQLVIRQGLLERMSAFERGSGKSGILLVVGEPGTGKTAFVAKCIEQREASRPVYHIIKRRRRDEEWDTPDIFYKSLTAQLRRKHALLRTEEEAGKPIEQEFLAVLGRISKRGVREVIWIDGLDEAFGATARFDGPALAVLRDQRPEASKATLPEGIYFVLTSRQGAHLSWLIPTPSCETVHLADMQVANEAEIWAYFEERSSQELRLSRSFIEQAVRCSENNFLYAVLLVNELRRLPPENRTPERIPGGLATRLKDQLASVIGAWAETENLSEEDARRDVLAVLGLLASVVAVLSLDELAALLTLTPGEIQKSVRLLSLAGEFIRGRARNEPLSFFHSQFREFILDQAGPVLLKSIHVRLAERCLDWHTLKDSVATYALRHLTTHVRMAERWDPLGRLLTDIEFLQTKIGVLPLGRGGEGSSPAPHTVFDMLREFSDALFGVPAFPVEHPARPRVEAIHRVLSPYGNALRREPALLVQQLYNGLAAGPDKVPDLVEKLDVAARRLARPWLKARKLPASLEATLLKSNLSGHRHAVHSVVFDPSSRTRLLASAGADGAIIIWDSGTGLALKRIPAHKHPVTALAFSKDDSGDGLILASASLDDTIRFWDPITYKQLDIAPTPLACPALSLDFSPTSRTLAAGCLDGTVRILDVNSLRWIESFPEEAPPGGADADPADEGIPDYATAVHCVVYSSDGSMLASGGRTKRVRLWNLATRRCLAFPPQPTWIESLAFSHDDRIIASGGGLGRGEVQLWDAQTGAFQRQLPTGHNDGIWALAFSRDDEFLLTGSWDRRVGVCNVESGRWLCPVAHGDVVLAVAISPDQKVLASASADRSVKLWDFLRMRNLDATPDQKALSVLAHRNTIHAARFSPDGRTLVSGSADRTVKSWRVSTGECTTTLPSPSGSILKVTICPRGEIVAAGVQGSGEIMLWNASNHRSLGPLTGHSRDVRALGFCPLDPTRLASGGSDTFVMLWDVTGRKWLKTFSGHTAAVRAVAFSPTAPLLASGGDDGKVIIWDWHTGEKLRVLDGPHGHRRRVKSVAFSPDGRWIASGGGETIKIWDAATGTILMTFAGEHGHTDEIWALAFSGDSRLLVSGSRDKMARLWLVESGSMVACLPCANSVLAVWISADSTEMRVTDAGGGDGIPNCYVHEIVSPAAFAPGQQPPAS